MMRRLSLVASLALALTLSSCSRPAPPAEPAPSFPVSVKVANFAELPMPNYASFGVVNLLGLTAASAGLAPQATEYSGFLLALDTVPIGPDGTFTWDLGDGSDIPASYMALAMAAFDGPETTCSLSASNASAQVLRTVPSPLLVSPVGLVGPLTHGTLYSDGALFYTDSAGFSLEPTSAVRHATWTFASDPVSIEGECVHDDGVGPATTIAVDLDLEAGWNSVVLAYDPAAHAATLTSGTIDGAWLFVEP